MAEEREARERDSKGEFNDGRTPDSLFIEGLESAQQQEQQTYEQESEVAFNQTDSQSWTMGSLDDLTPEELGLDDFELNTGIVDEVAETTEHKEIKFVKRVI